MSTVYIAYFDRLIPAERLGLTPANRGASWALARTRQVSSDILNMFSFFSNYSSTAVSSCRDRCSLRPSDADVSQHDHPGVSCRAVRIGYN